MEVAGIAFDFAEVALEVAKGLYKASKAFHHAQQEMEEIAHNLTVCCVLIDSFQDSVAGLQLSKKVQRTTTELIHQVISLSESSNIRD